MAIFILRVTANREDQVADFLSSNAERKGLPVYAVIRPHKMRGYIIVEAQDRNAVERAAFGVPYARGVLKGEVPYKEIENLVEVEKKEQVVLKKKDVVEIIAGPFKHEKAKIIRIDKTKNSVVVELLNAAVPIPITLNEEDVKVIRREEE